MVTNHKIGGVGYAREETPEELARFMQDSRWVHYVGLVFPPRPGVHECVVTLEHTCYKPGTPKNDDFHFRVFNWSGVVLVMVSIPVDEANFMEQIADQCGLRIRPGVPVMVSGDGVHTLPVSNERVFNLINKPDHPVYQHDPKVNAEIARREELMVKEIIRSSIKKTEGH